MIWCVEDDADIRDIELYALQSSGFEAKGFVDGPSCWAALKQEQPALMLLDVMMPGMDGIELLTKMKESAEYRRIPVIMATARGQEYDRIRGLELGADDYIVKPFSVMEMVSRVRAVLRRSQPEQAPDVLKSGGLVVRRDRRTVTLENQPVTLTYKEFELLCLFLSRPGMVFTREQLFSHVWGSDYMGDSRTLDSHIRTLRQKLADCGGKIQTVRHVGYRWEADDDS